MTKHRSFVFALGGVLTAAVLSLVSGLGSGATPVAATPDTRSWSAFLASVGAKPPGDVPASDLARREQVVASCMAQKGLPYQPIDWEQVNAVIAEARKQLPKTEEEWLERYGYGVTATLDGTMPSQKIDDPNVAVVDGMSPDQKVAYGQVRKACNATAATAVPAASGVTIPQSVAKQIDNVHAAALRDQRVGRATAAWSECMAARGFSYPNQDAIVADLQQQAAPLRDADVRVKGVPAALQGQLDAMRSVEMAIAAADADCRPSLETVISDVTTQYEATYLAKNGQQIADAMVRGR